jgi:hypothetical protein
MVEQIAVLETRTLNGRMERTCPIFIATLAIQKDLYEDESLRNRAHTLLHSARMQGRESSEVNHFLVKSYGIGIYTLSSPDFDHTSGMAEAVARGYGLEYEITRVSDPREFVSPKV